MMAAILNSAMLNSAILDSAILFKTLRFTQLHSFTVTLTQSHSFWLNLTMAAINLSCCIQPSWFSHFAQNSNSKTLSSFWLKLIQYDSLIYSRLMMMADILNSCHLGFSHFAQIKVINSFSLNFMMASILNSAMIEFRHFATKKLHSFIALKNTLTPLLTADSNMDSAILHKKKLHSFILIQLWMMAAILNSAILDSDTAILDSNTLVIFLSNSLKTYSDSIPNFVLKLIQSDSNSFILTQLDDGSHLVFCHLEFCHLGFSPLSFVLKLTHTLRLVPTICIKIT